MGVVRMIEYQGKTYRFTELCEKLQINYVTLRRRVAEGWPGERWAERPKVIHQKRPTKEIVRRPVVKKIPKGLLNGYTDYELFQLYRGFAGQSGEVRMLANFMNSDIQGAEEKIRKWKKEGRI